jgi:hypothetical protein
LAVTLTDEATATRVYWLDVTPEVAAAMLDRNTANRNMRGRAVDAYARDMAGDRWLVTGDTIKVSTAGEILDGQHRLAGVVESKTTQRLLIIEGLAPETRNVIDTGTPRTGGDALRLAGFAGEVHGNAEALASAARLLHLWGVERLTHMSSAMYARDRVTHAEIIDMVTHRPDLIDAVNVAARDYNRTGIPTGPGAMARTVLADVDAPDAERFFEALAGYATEGANDPRAVLLHTIAQMRQAGQLRKPGEAVGLVFSAWNAWRDGQKITALTTRDRKGNPLRIPQPL